MRFSDSNNDNPISFIQYPDITTYILQYINSRDIIQLFCNCSEIQDAVIHSNHTTNAKVEINDIDAFYSICNKYHPSILPYKQSVFVFKYSLSERAYKKHWYKSIRSYCKDVRIRLKYYPPQK